MSEQIGRLPTRRAKPKFWNVVVMISLVLFLLGVLGIFAIQFQTWAKSSKEKVEMNAYLKEKVSETRVLQLKKMLEAEPFSKTVEFISKEDAVKHYQKSTGEDVEELAGYNPLPASFTLHLKASYVNTDSLKQIEETLLSYPEIKTASADKQIVSKLSSWNKIVGLVLLGISGLILLIVFTLIDKTIRLAMYSNRFLIRSMQLVGATRSFIIRPYIRKGIVNGLLSGILASLFLAGLIYGVDQLLQGQNAPINIWDESVKFGALFAGLIILGILISTWSTYRSVRKYLRLKLDELY